MEYVKHRWIKPMSIEKRTYQENIVKTAMKGNTLCVLPTGLGKTACAALVVANRLEQTDGKILFLAPSRPLVEQHRKTFEKFLKIGTDELIVLTGRIKPEERAKLYEKAIIVFATPQTIKNDLMFNRLDLKDYVLLIVDEAHRSVKRYSYTFVAEKYIEQSDNPLIFAITASPGGQRYRINEVKNKLFIKYVEIRTREDIDVKPYVKDIEIQRVEVELTPPLENVRTYLENIKTNRLKKLKEWGFIENEKITKKQILELQQQISEMENNTKYTVLSYLAEILKLDHALTLLETQCLRALYNYLKKLKKQSANEDSKAVVRLTREEDFQNAYILTKKLIEQNIEHPKIEKLRELVKEEIKVEDAKIIIFTQFRDSVQKIFEVTSNINGCKPVLLIGQKGGLKQKEQIRIINEYELGFHNTLITTSIGEEGLHLGTATTAIFYEPIPSGIRSIQRKGRVGREREGKIYILVTKNTRDEAYHWSAYHKEKRMERTIRSMQEKSLLDF